MSGVNDGQRANMTTFNDAFISRNGDSSTVGKLDLQNTDSASGPDIINLQRNINQLASQLGVSTNGVFNALITWANTIVGSASSNSKAKIEALVLKMADTLANGGHTHTGVDGEGPSISALDLNNINKFKAEFQKISQAAASGTSIDVTSLMTGKVDTGGSASLGVITAPPDNKVALTDSSNNTFVTEPGGKTVYGRITFSSGVWTLSFFVDTPSIGTPYNLPSTDIDAYFLEVFNLNTVPTIPSIPALFGQMDVTNDIADASPVRSGKVNTTTQSFAGNKTFQDLLETQSSFRFEKSLLAKCTADSTSTGSIAFNPGDKFVVAFSNAGLTEIETIIAPLSTYTQVLALINRTGNIILVKNETGATPANRILTGTGDDLEVADGAGIMVMYDTTTSRWQVIGGSGSGTGSGSGGKNYVVNPGLEQNLKGFSLFNVALTNKFPSATPSSGAASIDVFSILTTGQLAGKKSLNVESTAAFTAGHGFRTDVMKIDKEDLARVFKFSLKYEVLSGSSNLVFDSDSDSSFGVAIYDVTNDAWIQPSNCYFLNANGVVGEARGEFKTVLDSDEYRLCVFCANTTGGAAAIQFDSFEFGPKEVDSLSRPIGLKVVTANASAPMTSTPFDVVYNTIKYDDFGIYNPTTGEAKIKVPGRVRVRGGVIIGAVYSLGNANSTRIDLNGAIIKDEFQRTAALSGVSLVQHVEATLDVKVGDVIKIIGYTDGASPSVVGDALYDSFEIEYLNLGDTAHLLQIKNVEAYLYASAGYSLPAATPTRVPLDAALWDSHGGLITSGPDAGKYFIKEPGKYRIYARTSHGPGGAGSVAAVQILYDTALILDGGKATATSLSFGAGDETELKVTPADVAAGKLIEVKNFCQHASSALGTFVYDALIIERVPDEVLAGTTLPVQRIKVTNSATQSIPAGTLTKIMYDNSFPYPDSNDDGHFNFTLSRFQPTRPGIWSCKTSAFLVGTNNRSYTIIVKNGTTELAPGHSGGVTGDVGMNGFEDIYLNGTTDYLEVHVYSFSSISTTLDNTPRDSFFQARWVCDA